MNVIKGDIMLEDKKRISKIIWFFLFLMPFLDVVTSFMIHFQGRSSYLVLAIKFLFLLFLIGLNLKYQNKKIFWFGSIFTLYICLFFLVATQLSFFFLEAQGLFRTFYFPFLLLSFSFLQKEDFFAVTKSQLLTLLFWYLFFLVVPEIFHLGFASYAHSKVGGIGWFYSTNEIGGILAILGPFLFHEYINHKRWFLFLLILFYILGILVLGSKAPVLALGIIVVCFFLQFLVTVFRSKNWKKFYLSILSSFLFILVFGMILRGSSFYKNIKIHLDFLGIHEVKELFTYQHIDHFVFSERLTFLAQTHHVYMEQNKSRQLLGMGVLESEELGRSMKMIEMDGFDVFYHYGVCGFFLFVYPFFNFLRKRKFTFEEKICFALLLLLSFFTGHILVAPSVSLLVVLVLLPKKEEVK